MQKILIINPEKCTGCRICEQVCAFHHERECNPAKSRIHIIKWEKGGLDVPMVCQQCDIPVCEKICPVRAISRDPKTGAMVINHDICIGCRMCLIICPLGGPSIDVEKKRTIKCDLCEGDPICSKFCPTGAIEYITPTKATLLKKRDSIKKIGELVRLLVVTS